MAIRFIRWRWISAVFSLVALLAAGAIVFTAVVPISSNTLRRRLVDSLSARLDSDVELSDVHLHLFPRLRVDGSGLLVRRRGSVDRPPLITVKAFSVDSDLAGLFRNHLAHVTLEGLEIQIPPEARAGKNDSHDIDLNDTAPKTDTPSNATSDGARPDRTLPNKAWPETALWWFTGARKFARAMVIDALDTDDASLAIIPADKDKRPAVWAIHHLHMNNLGVDQPMPFRATLTNGVPPGEIDTIGHFGPWHRDEPGQTHLDGTFTFAEANLSVFKGIRGMLSARGDFRGTLNRIDVSGETDTPDFTIDVSGHPFPLHTKYHTIVDGTNGNTHLERIDARFLQSSLVAKGSVVQNPHDRRGRTISLNLALTRARLEDVLVMAVKTPKPPMVGVLKMTTTFLLPPGETDVVERLQLGGQFSIERVRFTSFDVQGRIEALSRLARGQKNVADKESVASKFQGRFKLGDGQLELSNLTFEVPGAKVQLDGGYALRAETLDFHGVVSMDAKLSQTQTGIKSLLLKAVDPFFRKNGTSQLPIRIRGTRSDPSFGLDVRRVFKRGN
ncbi:MAG TPA: AsmA-like C-terminal region-containing protein [Vicinamibacterales bacterium]|nr:AsmA-like C-terminal region-containing protein [Vicinamibacterales bacterium]